MTSPPSFFTLTALAWLVGVAALVVVLVWRGSLARQLRGLRAEVVRVKKLATLGEFSAGVVHEIKNPMTGIISFAQLARTKANDPEKLAELLGLIEKQALRCKEILDGYLNLARQQRGTKELVNLNAMVQDVAKLLGYQLGTKKVTLEVKLAPDVPAVAGNAAELQQVLLNLALNAQQAMPTGGRVEVETRRNGEGSAAILVRDNGPGMSEEVRRHIFEPFFTTKPAGQGTGLGLTLSLAIIQEHDGKIGVDSAPGRGTTFTIDLPAPARRGNSDG